MHNLIVTMPPGKVVKGIKRPKAKALKPPYPKRKPKKASGKASAARLKLAADHGTKVHSYIEDYVKSDGNSDHIPKKTLLGKKALALIEHATKKMKLKLWQAEVYAKSPFLTNKRMFIDCLALDKNKRVVVIDWKTRSASSAVHLATFKAKTADAIPGTNLCSNDKNRFMLQVAAYALAVQEKYGLCEPPLAYILVCTNDLLVHEYQLEDWALDPTRGYLRRKSEAEQSAKRQIKTSRDSLALFLKFLNKQRPEGEIKELTSSPHWLGLRVAKILAKNEMVRQVGKLRVSIRLHTVAETRAGMFTSIFNYTNRVYDAGAAGGMVKVGRMHTAALRRLAKGQSVAVVFVHKDGVWKARENDVIKIQ